MCSVRHSVDGGGRYKRVDFRSWSHFIGLEVYM